MQIIINSGVVSINTYQFTENNQQLTVLVKAYQNVRSGINFPLYVYALNVNHKL